MSYAYLVAFDPEGGYANLDWMPEYVEHVMKIIDSYGGEYLVRYQPSQVIEGDLDPGPLVLVRFPSMERLRAFYESDEYRPWREHRHEVGGTQRIIAFEE